MDRTSDGMIPIRESRRPLAAKLISAYLVGFYAFAITVFVAKFFCPG